MITYRNTNCRRNLCYYTYIRICKSFPDFIHMRLNGNGTCRTIYTALSAVYTLGFCDFLIKRRNYNSLCSAIGEIQCADSLKFLAGTYTIAAKDTLIWITDQRWGTVINFILLSCILKTDVMYSKTVSQLLKHAFSTLYTGCTVTAVCCEKQFHNQFPVFFDLT